MRSILLLIVGTLALTVIWGCINLPAEVSLLPTGTPFVIQGTSAVVDYEGPCPVWVGENGVTYHLFQDPLLNNETFDQVVTPGTTSRLVVVTRSDLVVSCEMGTIVEVQDVLQIFD